MECADAGVAANVGDGCEAGADAEASVVGDDVEVTIIDAGAVGDGAIVGVAIDVGDDVGVMMLMDDARASGNRGDSVAATDTTGTGPTS